MSPRTAALEAQLLDLDATVTSPPPSARYNAEIEAKMAIVREKEAKLKEWEERNAKLEVRWFYFLVLVLVLVMT